MTLYSISKEGKGSAGPLTAALAIAVTEAAEERAALQRGGRLEVPMVVILDEAANVCRWRELPDQYSHYGSRGIAVTTILQSWAQGVEVWGKEGIEKLFSAANIVVYGGNVKDVQFLGNLSQLLGKYDKITRSSSSSTSRSRSRQISTQIQRENILDVDELAALPEGRALVFAAGARPTMIAPVRLYEGPHKAAVESSFNAHDPGRHDPGRQADREKAPGTPVHRQAGQAPQFGPATSVIKEL